MASRLTVERFAVRYGHPVAEVTARTGRKSRVPGTTGEFAAVQAAGDPGYTVELSGSGGGGCAVTRPPILAQGGNASSSSDQQQVVPLRHSGLGTERDGKRP